MVTFFNNVQHVQEGQQTFQHAYETEFDMYLADCAQVR